MNQVELSRMISELKSSYVESFQEDKERHFNFVLIGNNRKWEVAIYFPESFPYCLPWSKLLNQALIGTLAHVNQFGTICIEESDTVFADYTRAHDIICQYIEGIVKLLNRVSLKIYQDELLDELEGYYQPNYSVASFYHAKDKAEMVYLRVIEREKKKGPQNSIPVVMCSRNKALPYQFSNVKQLGQYRATKILHLPLDSAVLPPVGGKDFSSQYFTTLLNHLSEQNKKILNKLVKKCRSFNIFYVLLSMPRTNGERTQFLLRFSANHHLPHPIVEHSNDWQIELFSIRRNSKEYLLERGGGDILLSDKKVAVVGCGSVGGQVVNMLAKAGVGELVLVDPDILSADNLYRHHLGGRELNFEADKKTGHVYTRSKVNSLARQLQNDLPYIKVKTKPLNFSEAINDKDLVSCDAIVVAVGVPSVNLQINQVLKDRNFNNVVFCWNEAAGLGGHSIALNLQDSCYQCLYTDGNQLKAESELSLVCVGQSISKNLTGCAGVFTPFSFLDSSRTAELAATQTIEILQSFITGLAISWKGNNSTNLKTTDRYSTMPLKEQLPLKQHHDCRVCND
ncbi:ThiF family adenylyltransferase [Pseudoalteromonas sp. SR44-2]|uniref:ThiF family adenylyltransferase n=1 Tax=Pseudoalteromonas sp. SR44-2 TaxID=2760937 RepID=UPI0016026048|nr:ThiF family adenylyltransferase [Pseudoalteromonas sp. SR44-2]MBB1339293.1 ThiF family adenylyltransferase [Pseudoalteromonas sp. SR44-2]